ADLDGAQQARDLATGSAAVERVKPTRCEQQEQGQEDEAPRHATIFTSRSGTTMILRGAAPLSWRWTLPEASASSSTAARSSPRGAASVSRSLPFTWTASVTRSSTSSAGSNSGHAA